jgi:hypothetical protein
MTPSSLVVWAVAMLLDIASPAINRVAIDMLTGGLLRFMFSLLLHHFVFSQVLVSAKSI